jgi:hypothetical protein
LDSGSQRASLICWSLPDDHPDRKTVHPTVIRQTVIRQTIVRQTTAHRSTTMEPASASDSAQESRNDVGCRSNAEPTLASACAMLCAAVALGGSILGAYQYAEHGIAGVEAVTIATIACGLSSLFSLIVAGRLRGTPYAVAGQLGGMLVRMAPPLVVVLMLQPRLPLISAAGLFGCTVACFLFTLLVETVLLVRLVRSGAGGERTMASSGMLSHLSKTS